MLLEATRIIRGREFIRLEVGRLHFHVYAGPNRRYYRMAFQVAWNGHDVVGYSHLVRLEIK